MRLAKAFLTLGLVVVYTITAWAITYDAEYGWRYNHPGQTHYRNVDKEKSNESPNIQQEKLSWVLERRSIDTALPENLPSIMLINKGENKGITQIEMGFIEFGGNFILHVFLYTHFMNEQEQGSENEKLKFKNLLQEHNITYNLCMAKDKGVYWIQFGEGSKVKELKTIFSILNAIEPFSETILDFLNKICMFAQASEVTQFKAAKEEEVKKVFCGEFGA